MNITAIKSSLLDEAITSPNLLSDLSGLESYISESYTNRSFIELLQNADDAEATRFKVKRSGNYLIVANNGRVFNQRDIESLCRSAASNKTRGTAIGYRGIGFKSVVSIAKEVHILSGDLEITFSRELTKALIPEANRVPLIRIPHNLRESVKHETKVEIAELRQDGYTTIFIFSDVVTEQIGDEFADFKHTSLLFLNHITETDICLGDNIKTTIHSIDKGATSRRVAIDHNGVTSDWLIHSFKGCSIAYSLKDNHIVRLPKNEAIIHAFLPTEDSSGLGVIVNGDFSTDPSRRHLIIDETTKGVIGVLAKLYVKHLSDNLYNASPDSVGLITALLPYSDMRMVQFTKNKFEQILSERIKEEVGNSLDAIKLMPSWFNTKDFNLVRKQQGGQCINEALYNITDALPLLKFLGAKESTLKEILNVGIINSVDLSVQGCVQIAQSILRATIMQGENISTTEFAIFYANNNRISLGELDRQALKIDSSFMDLLYNKGILESDMRAFLKKLSLTTLLELQFPTKQSTSTEVTAVVEDATPHKAVGDWFNNLPNSTKPIESNNLSLKRWRSAEEQTLSILNQQGFRLEDVSLQNLGYDLEGYDPNGNKIYIEVKSITNAGQRFRVTNNEFGVAQIKQDSYYIAVVMQEGDEFHIAMIKNPTNTLNLNRQCVQWIWECADYAYTPYKFKLQ